MYHIANCSLITCINMLHLQHKLWGRVPLTLVKMMMSWTGGVLVMSQECLLCVWLMGYDWKTASVSGVCVCACVHVCVHAYMHVCVCMEQ